MWVDSGLSLRGCMKVSDRLLAQLGKVLIRECRSIPDFRALLKASMGRLVFFCSLKSLTKAFMAAFTAINKHKDYMENFF
jgi:hypothetical protein